MLDGFTRERTGQQRLHDYALSALFTGVCRISTANDCHENKARLGYCCCMMNLKRFRAGGVKAI